MQKYMLKLLKNAYKNIYISIEKNNSYDFLSTKQYK